MEVTFLSTGGDASLEFLDNLMLHDLAALNHKVVKELQEQMGSSKTSEIIFAGNSAAIMSIADAIDMMNSLKTNGNPLSRWNWISAAIPIRAFQVLS